MKHYTETIPIAIATKLKEKGMPIEVQPLYAQEAPNARGIVKAGVGLWCPSYAEVFDWLMSEKGWLAAIGREYDFADELVTERFEWGLEKVGCFSSHSEDESGFCDTWHEAAISAIEKALTLI